MIQESIDLLGLKAKDTVTGFEGVISSVAFDLYGCVQVVITPNKGSDGKLGDSHYFDVNRVNILSKKPVMAVPDFKAIARKPKEFSHGPAEKPKARS